MATTTPASGRDQNYVIVVGGGRVGFHLAKELLEQQYEVLVIESDEGGPRAAYIADQLGSAVVRGDGCEARVLEEAGCVRASLLIAVTGDDEDNLVACQVAKNKFGVPRTIARLSDPRNEPLFLSLGIDVTVSATAAILDKIEMELPLSRLHRLLSFKRGDVEIVEVRLPERGPLTGKTVRDVLLPQGALIILLMGQDGTPRVPSPEMVLRPGDEVIAIIKPEDEDRIRAILTGAAA